MSNLKLSLDLLGLENVKKAYSIANNAIYFNDNSDYLTALYEICKVLNPQVDTEQIGNSFIDDEIL
ncbi:hypothetical protein [Zhenhengia sp.]|uniref:hypothetical protein n=1 Tax=Zhenhengia sp. TaxID=2944208 RepID=UPI003079E0D6